MFTPLSTLIDYIIFQCTKLNMYTVSLLLYNISSTTRIQFQFYLLYVPEDNKVG